MLTLFMLLFVEWVRGSSSNCWACWADFQTQDLTLLSPTPLSSPKACDGIAQLIVQLSQWKGEMLDRSKLYRVSALFWSLGVDRFPSE